MAVDSWGRARDILSAAGLPADTLAGLATLGGGTYNAVEELRLTVIMLTETVPRAVGEEHEAWVRQMVDPELLAALAEIEEPAPRKRPSAATGPT